MLANNHYIGINRQICLDLLRSTLRNPCANQTVGLEVVDYAHGVFGRRG